MADPQVPPEIAAALEKGNLIEAIRLLRQKQKSLGLAEAKSIIEAMQRQSAAAGGHVKVNVTTTMRPTVSVRRAMPRPVAGRGEFHLAPGQVPGSSGGTGAAIAVLVIVGLAIAGAIVAGLL